jgi:hypothetical protein
MLRGVNRAAFSFTFDIGFEKGQGVNGFSHSDPLAPAQYFASAMLYHRVWFAKNRLAWTMGGGVMKNPGRYLVLPPTGQASPLPSPTDPTLTAGAFPFSLNPGDSFDGWDCSTGLDLMPHDGITFRLEFVHRQTNVPYFAGPGGITSQTGFATSALDPSWRPDLVKAEDRLIIALLFRM